MIVVTGASRGIGLFLSRKFAASGIEVNGIFHQTPPEQTGSIAGLSLTSCDITDWDAIGNWVNSLHLSGKNITLLNCAGINYNSFGHKADPLEWKKVIDVNLTATFNLIRLFLPAMRKEGWGRIINFSSVVSQTGVPGTSAYAASKAGLNGMIKSLAVENASKGITINNLNLGYFNIGMISEVPAEFLNQIIAKVPAGRLGDPENIYEAVEFIRKADYMNGACIDINGGLH